VCDAELYNLFLIEREFSPVLSIRVFRAVNRSLIKPGLSAYFPLMLVIFPQKTCFLAGIKTNILIEEE